MTRKSAHSSRQREARFGQGIFIPHSSWSRVQRPAGMSVLAPEDFWARLGL